MTNDDVCIPPGDAAATPQTRAEADHLNDAPYETGAVIPFQRYTEFGTRWPVPGPGEVLVVPLGGLGRIGMNWTLYGHDGAWLLVDAGIAFPDAELAAAGVEAVVPDPAFLLPIRERLAGLVVTHGHEDHIGAIDRLWPHAVNCPIWATPFAAASITRRLEETGTLGEVVLNSYPVGGAFAVGPFQLTSVRVTHSIPEPVSLAIGTAAGTVMHTGDWKFDPEPLVGEPTDFETLRRLGDEGVLALVCDSTNAHKEMPETSEAHVREAFQRLFAERDGQIAVCCFSTNVARLASALVAAAATDRYIAVAGRSLRNSEETARNLGLLDGVPESLSEPSHLKGLDRRATALVCTGGQGEEKAALAKLARGDRRLPSFGHGDTVVISARVIPGNEESVDRVVSALRKRGVEVLMGHETIDGLPFHVSGHPGAGELRRMYELLRPRFALPVHGTEMHLTAHATLARAAGVEKALVADEAEVVRVAPGGVRVLGRISAPLMHLVGDGSGNRVPYRLTAALG